MFFLLLREIGPPRNFPASGDAISPIRPANSTDGIYDYEYDVFDRRIANKVDDTGNGTIDRAERFVYDESGKVDSNGHGHLDDIVLVFDDTSSLTTRYLHGPGIDNPFSAESLDEIFGDPVVDELVWLLTDHQGSVRDTVSYDDGTDTTSIDNHIQYDAFGNITGETDSTATPLHAYTGREWDEDAQLYYFRKRWYDAGVGQFVSDDPIGFAAGDANVRRYVSNAPTNATDPSGLEHPGWVYSLQYYYGGNFSLGYWHPSLPPAQPDTPPQSARKQNRIRNSRYGLLASGVGGDVGVEMGQKPQDTLKSMCEPEEYIEAGREAADLVTSYAPGVSDLRDGAEFVTGYHTFEQRPLTWFERVITGVATLLPIAGAGSFRKALGGVGDVVRHSDELADGVSDAAKKYPAPVHIDIGGEGRYPRATNLNPSETGMTGRPIQNRVAGRGDNLPFGANHADGISLENAPISPQTATEIARVIKPGGSIRLVSPSDYATAAHQRVIDAISGGNVVQTTKNGITTTVITVPK